METGYQTPPKRKVTHLLILLFGLLITAIITNAIVSGIQTSHDALNHAQEDVKSRLNIVASVHNSQIDKLEILSLIVKEQNQRFCDFMDYDNLPAITYMLKSLVSIHDIDFAVIFNDEQEVLTTYPGGANLKDPRIYSELISNHSQVVGLEMLSAAIVDEQFPEMAGTLDAAVARRLCFIAVIPLVHDTGDLYGHVVLAKLINGNKPLMDHMFGIAEAHVIYFDLENRPLLSSFPEVGVPVPLDKRIHFNGKSYFAAFLDLTNPEGQPVGTLAVAYDDDTYLHQRKMMLISTLPPFVVSACISIILLFLLKRRVFDKIQALSKALRTVTRSQGDLSVRIDPSYWWSTTEPPDEVAYMCVDFNRMMNKLETTYDQMIEARRAAEAANKVLEKRVKERTAQLTDMYRDLELEMEERQRAEMQRQQLEQTLQRARKMEALGTLAGGVAHDLNNILSGLVSYPELLLLELPEDSPLRKPILTIKESGEKAADIVQDLLTLARRGVAATEVLNLNDIIRRYLASPECAKLKADHPGVMLETSLDQGLLNISGSAVHLSKTLMNLVYNAAEAMPNGGKVKISTENQYIDTPFEGYDAIDEGDYVRLIVADEGVGISKDDLERIFEPFFTKKVMGRSGTGLGMSVVWGTVKDHDGYIDVKSTEGNGATFTLYFPVTREKIGPKKSAAKLRDLLGGGERVLIVDDIPQQRDIASEMAIKLGYTVDTVASGEEALAYCAQREADILILDMIMPGGMDGLETYKRIAEIRPGQKAVIASGFSETDRVKEAQERGVGEYIKKPYTLEKLGIALKMELNRRRN